MQGRLQSGKRAAAGHEDSQPCGATSYRVSNILGGGNTWGGKHTLSPRDTASVDVGLYRQSRYEGLSLRGKQDEWVVGFNLGE